VHNHGTISFNAELILIHDVLTMCFTTSVRMWDTSVLVYEAIYEATCVKMQQSCTENYTI